MDGYVLVPDRTSLIKETRRLIVTVTRLFFPFPKTGREKSIVNQDFNTPSEFIIDNATYLAP